MIRKFYEAKVNKVLKLSFWGSGEPQRDFVYAHDVASLFPLFSFRYEGNSPINLSSGTSISMKILSSIIANKVGYNGEINWDINQPDGQMIKIFSVEKLKSLGKACNTSLEAGLDKTIDWFMENYNNGNIRL